MVSILCDLHTCQTPIKSISGEMGQTNQIVLFLLISRTYRYKGFLVMLMYFLAVSVKFQVYLLRGNFDAGCLSKIALGEKETELEG